MRPSLQRQLTCALDLGLFQSQVLCQTTKPARKMKQKRPGGAAGLFFLPSRVEVVAAVVQLPLQVTSLWKAAKRILTAPCALPWGNRCPLTVTHITLLSGWTVLPLFGDPWHCKGFQNHSWASGIVSVAHVPQGLASASPLLGELVGFWHAFFIAFPPPVL